MGNLGRKEGGLGLAVSREFSTKVQTNGPVSHSFPWACSSVRLLGCFLGIRMPAFWLDQQRPGSPFLWSGLDTSLAISPSVPLTGELCRCCGRGVPACSQWLLQGLLMVES